MFFCFFLSCSCCYIISFSSFFLGLDEFYWPLHPQLACLCGAPVLLFALVNVRFCSCCGGARVFQLCYLFMKASWLWCGGGVGETDGELKAQWNYSHNLCFSSSFNFPFFSCDLTPLSWYQNTGRGARPPFDVKSVFPRGWWDFIPL